MFYKNWPNICKIENPHFRLAVALSDDQVFLYKIANAFPELDILTEEKPEHKGPFPLSYLREIAAFWCKNSQAGGEDLSTFYILCDEIGMPTILCAHPNADVFDDHCLVMPTEISNATRYQELCHAYYDTDLNSTGFPDRLIPIQVNGESFYLGWINDGGAKNNDEKDMYIYPATLVDTNA